MYKMKKIIIMLIFSIVLLAIVQGIYNANSRIKLLELKNYNNITNQLK